MLTATVYFKEKFWRVKSCEHLFWGPMDLIIYIHRKDSALFCIWPKWTSEILHVWLLPAQILGGVHLWSLKLDDATHCRLESHWICMEMCYSSWPPILLISAVLGRKEDASGYWSHFLRNDPVDGTVVGFFGCRVHYSCEQNHCSAVKLQCLPLRPCWVTGSFTQISENQRFILKSRVLTVHETK